MNPRPVNTRKLTKKDRTQSYVQSQCIGCVRSPFGHFWTSLYLTKLWFSTSGCFHRRVRSLQLMWIRSISSVTVMGGLIYFTTPLHPRLHLHRRARACISATTPASASPPPCLCLHLHSPCHDADRCSHAWLITAAGFLLCTSSLLSPLSCVPAPALLILQSSYSKKFIGRQCLSLVSLS